ncbi:MAG: sulfite exporter TauE/SafE family protein [Actinobacteria bacterium]|nr:sulfite exporter TauE/SafE family protein [Actinomycetota bacterium]
MTAPAESETAFRPSWWILALVGVIGGVLSGAFGVGGGILMVPLLIGLAKMNQRQAAATSLLAIVPTAIAGSATYLIAGQMDVFAALFLGIGGVVGSLYGTRLLKQLPLGVLRWGFIVLLVVVAIRMVLVIPDRSSGHLEPSVLAALGLVAMGLFVGVASGLFGIGGGVIAVPALIAVFGLGDLIAKGTSLLFMIPTAVTGSVNNSRNGLVDVRAGLIVGVAATVASFGGAALAFLMSPAVSSYLFAALLLVSALQLTVRAIRMRRA